MSEDLTQKLPQSEGEMLNLILTTTKNLETGFGNLESRVGEIDTRLQRLEQKVEERLYDARPIWHKVVSDIAHLQSGQDSLAANITGLQTNITELQTGQQGLRSLIFELSSTVREVNRDQIIMNDVIRRIQLDFHNFDERLHRFLLNNNQQNSST